MIMGNRKFVNYSSILSNATINQNFATFINKHLLFQEEFHLPIQASKPHQFILHIILLFGRFATKLILFNILLYIKHLGISNRLE